MIKNLYSTVKITVDGKTLKYKVKNPVLEHAFFNPGTDIENRKKTALGLSKQYQFREYILKDGEDKEQARHTLEKIGVHGLYIIKAKARKKDIILDYAFIDRQFNFNKNRALDTQKTIKAGHQVYNASKKFKLRQATGRQRVENFKCYAMGLKG